MRRVRLETSRISDWISFHEQFAQQLRFRDHYGRNMNAWIDCMSDAVEDETMVLEVADSESFRQRCPELFDALVECTAFVNDRFKTRAGPAVSLIFTDDE